MTVPDVRVRALNAAALDPKGRYVVYWMTAFRRAHHNFALQRAVEHARALDKPLVILEALRCDYRWASHRFHRFVMQGMLDNERAFASTDARYYPYVEPRKGAGRGLLEALAKEACVVVSDDFPCFFLPRMATAAAERLDVLLELVDSNGIFPLRASEDAFATAHAFRRFLQKNLRPHLDALPDRDPLAKVTLKPARIPSNIQKTWPATSPAQLTDDAFLETLPIDPSVTPVEREGGPNAAQAALKRFLTRRFDHYENRNSIDDDPASGLSPYLHFGHVSAHDIFRKVVKREGWTASRLGDDTRGKRTGWWGMSAAAEGFLDQLVTWRELGYQFCAHRDDHDRFASLPDWAQRTLAKHAGDVREHKYTLLQFETAATHDPLWNAAQRQLLRDGTIHNYLRMLWGKKILEWTRDAREALDVMIELNNKYAIDGRNPNSYSGIFWVLGRHDRAWGPERPVFGTVRFMSSQSTARKMSTKAYLEEFSA